jgi:hypothetical protein
MRREAAKRERKLRSAAKVLDNAGISHAMSSLHPRNELDELSSLRSEVAGRAPPDDRYRAEYAAYQRYLAVEKLLLDALAEGKIVAEIQVYDGPTLTATEQLFGIGGCEPAI